VNTQSGLKHTQLAAQATHAPSGLVLVPLEAKKCSQDDGYRRELEGQDQEVELRD
jgi:hypothetical protein